MSISICFQVLFCLFVCFVALRPKSTAMVIAGRSVFQVTLKSDRKLYLKPYFYVMPNTCICKFRERFTSTSETMLIKLSKFVGII